MDSLTQIVLGAAMGEATLGRKIGNRAMLWGAIAGTIPDMDVVGNAFLNPVDALAFHRGISHSIFFAITFSFLMAWLVKKYYDKEHHKKTGIKWTNLVLGVVFMFFAGFVILVMNQVLAGVTATVVAGVIILALITFLTRRSYFNYLQEEQEDLGFVTFREWYMLFFWAIFTHPLLDSFTAYGTQLFQPFSDYRVALNTISIADPLYTLPFLVCIIIVAIFTRGAKLRPVFNWIGIGLSSLYLVYTIWNKSRVDAVMEDTLEQNNITYERYMTAPTILNNILWNGTVEADSLYYHGLYSLNDKEKTFKLFAISKGHHLLEEHIEDDKTLRTLAWFSNNYYNVAEVGKDTFQISDLRYGLMGGTTPKLENFVFKFYVTKGKDGKYKLISGGPARESDIDHRLEKLVERVNGI